MEKNVVELINVTKKINNQAIIDDINMKVREGEILGLLGPNGVGKTTTMKLIVGLLSLTHGDIFIKGKSIKNEFTTALANIGALIENPAFYPYLSGYQNLRVLANMLPNNREKRLGEAIVMSGLQDRMKDKVKTYSLGMRQRLGLAQALLGNPPILILDEPTNGLDPEGIKELRVNLRNLASRHGKTIIVSSHVLSEMELMCDQIAIIQKGKLIDMQKVNLDRETQPSNTVLFDVNDPLKAKEYLDNVGLKSDIQDGFLQIVGEREKIADVNTLLVNKGISVYGIRSQIKTLEERFIEIVGSDKKC